MQTVGCPHCGAHIANDGAFAGQVVACSVCTGQFRMPIPVAPVAQPIVVPGPNSSPASLTVPLLVSAISNIVVGLFWIGTCFGAPLCIPMFVLSAFEFSLYARFGRDPLAKLVKSASSLAIFEIIVGLANTPTLVCGIILMVNANKLSNTGTAGLQAAIPLTNPQNVPAPPPVIRQPPHH